MLRVYCLWEADAVIFILSLFWNFDYEDSWSIYNIFADDSVIALANRCPHLRSLGLYYCRNITDRAMYSLVHNRVKNKLSMWESMKGRCDEEGLSRLNISQCTALTPPAVQALCDSFPALHTCSGRHSLVMSGCLNLTSVHCVCAVQAHRSASSFPHPAHWAVHAARNFKGALHVSLLEVELCPRKYVVVFRVSPFQCKWAAHLLLQNMVCKTMDFYQPLVPEVSKHFGFWSQVYCSNLCSLVTV
jgi:hypothetical protein